MIFLLLCKLKKNRTLGIFLNIFNNFRKNSNQQQSNEKPQQNSRKSASINHKPNKKSNKTKKTYMKNAYSVEETDQLPQTSNKNRIHFIDSTNSSKIVTPTKVKSGSWKRSEKSITPFHTITNKKHKSLRKKSPNWVRFSSSKTKKQETNSLDNESDPTSACKPGTLYSDVLFGAGCSSLVKIKNLTPRHCNNTTNSQKKLTKALFKFSGNLENETSDESEIEDKNNLFPALEKVKKQSTSPPLTKANNSEIKMSFNNESFNTIPISHSKKDTYEDADVVILSDLKSLSFADNNISYGNYLEQNCQTLNGKTATESKQFLMSAISNIPKWNFTETENGPETFPKFLCQFDDENYLKAEKIAMLSLKLALGTSLTKIK